MSTVAGVLNLVLGVVYLAYGVMTWVELRRGWASNGPSHFGLAWMFMTTTCGPHHLDHGLHLVRDGYGTALDLGVTALGFPAATVWFLLRVEALRGGEGDRWLRSGHGGVAALPVLSSMYVVVLGGLVATTLVTGRLDWVPSTSANVMILAFYGAIAWMLLRSQLVNHRLEHRWSLSGLSLTLVFATCAIMHGVHALNVNTGRYPYQGHLVVTDLLAVPAAVYFLWVVWRLSSGQVDDWNEAAGHSTSKEDDLVGAHLGIERA